MSDGDIVGREVRGMRGCRRTGAAIRKYTPCNEGNGCTTVFTVVFDDELGVREHTNIPNTNTQQYLFKLY